MRCRPVLLPSIDLRISPCNLIDLAVRQPRQISFEATNLSKMYQYAHHGKCLCRLGQLFIVDIVRHILNISEPQSLIPLYHYISQNAHREVRRVTQKRRSIEMPLAIGVDFFITFRPVDIEDWQDKTLSIVWGSRSVGHQDVLFIGGPAKDFLTEEEEDNRSVKNTPVLQYLHYRISGVIREIITYFTQ